MKTRQLVFLVIIAVALTVALLASGALQPGSGALVLLPLDKVGEVQLLNEQKEVVHRWRIDSPRAYLLPSGELFALHGTHSRRDKQQFKDSLKTISQYDWDGSEIWSYTHPEKLHHDFALFEDGIYLLSHRYTKGFFYERKVRGVPSQYSLRADTIVKIDLKGNVLWEWSVDPELFDTFKCKHRACYKNVKRKTRTLDWTHFNSLKILPPNKHFDEGYSQFRPGNLLVVARNWHQMLIFDTERKEIVWEYPRKNDEPMNGGHEASMIPKGFPGEGNILFFENGWDEPGKGRSAIKEFDPLSRKVVWSYQTDGFYSEYQGAVQRLSSGNTFISSDYQKSCFEVTPAGKVEWLYKANKHLYRCHRYEAEYLRR